MKSLDLWLRGVWTFWDTHGTRLLGVLNTLYSIIAAIVIAVSKADSAVAAAVIGIGGAFGWATHSRGTSNARNLASSPNTGARP